jgi:CHASE2 domain-containing sensor protein
LASLAVAALVLGARSLGWLQGLELAVYDAQLTSLPGAPSTSVVLVEITEADIQEQGHWPISDRRLAELLREIGEGGPRVIGLDLYRDLPNPPGEEYFRRTLRDDPRIFAVRKFDGP